MSEDALPVAIEARELGKSAHKRLDGVNGSIDRLSGKVDVIDSKVDSVLITLARQDGRELAGRGLLDSRRFLITIVVTVLTSSLVAFALTLALRGHP